MFRAAEVGVHGMTAPAAGEPLLAGQITFVDLAPSRASLAAVGRICRGGCDAMAVIRTHQLCLNDGPPSVVQDGAEPTGQTGMTTFMKPASWGRRLRRAARCALEKC